jgi:hypothetical protein
MSYYKKKKYLSFIIINYWCKIPPIQTGRNQFDRDTQEVTEFDQGGM